MDGDGKGVQRLTRTPFDEKDLSISPDGKEIVYAASDGRLHIIDIETKESEPLPLTISEGMNSQPSFSPDGREIVYVYFKRGGNG